MTKIGSQNYKDSPTIPCQTKDFIKEFDKKPQKDTKKHTLVDHVIEKDVEEQSEMHALERNQKIFDLKKCLESDRILLKS